MVKPSFMIGRRIFADSAANAQVALGGDFQAAADAGAGYHRHRRVAAVHDAGERLRHPFTVIDLRFLVGIAQREEFLDVASGGEGRALAADDDAAQAFRRRAVRPSPASAAATWRQ